MSRHRTIRRGFTLAELLLAGVLLAILGGGTTVVLSQMTRTREASGSRELAFSRADAAVTRMALDALNVIRDTDLRFTRVRITEGGDRDNPRSELLLLMRSLRPLRGLEDVPEGSDYEVQYRLGFTHDAPEMLWRRVDVAMDRVQDGGGVASPVVDGIVSLKVEACDGEVWWPQWDSDTDGLPHGLRITIVARDDAQRRFVTARRVIAIDRVPLPVEVSQQVEIEDEPTQPTPTPTPTPGGNQGGGAGGGGGGAGGGGPRRPGGGGQRGGGQGGGGPGAGGPGGGGQGGGDQVGGQPTRPGGGP